MRRVLLVSAAAVSLSVPVSVALVGSSSPAFASSSLTCTKISGSSTGTVTFKKCDVPSADKKTYKSGSISYSDLTSTGGNLTWSSSGATTTVSGPTVSSPGRGLCNNYSTEEDITATVSGGTSVVTNDGDTLTADICVSRMTGKVSLVKGSTASL